MFIVTKRVPSKVKDKALKVLEGFAKGSIKARLSYGKKFKTLVVNPSWRLIDKGAGWMLVSHNEYDKIIDKR